MSSITLSVDYDEACLSFDSTDSDSDGLADSVHLMVPHAFGATLVGHDPNDTDGEIDTVLADMVRPFEAMPDGVIMEVALTVIEESSCNGDEARVGFSSDPPAMFSNDEGVLLNGETEGGAIRIAVPASTATHTPTATATPTVTATPTQDQEGPSLSIEQEIPGTPGQTVVVPIDFDANGNGISSITFTVDYDQACLSFDPTDADFDGVPDSVIFKVPATFISQARFMDSTIRFVHFSLDDTMPDGGIVEIDLGVSDKEECRGASAEVGFSSIPAFGDNSGRPVTGWTQDGSVKIARDLWFNTLVLKGSEATTW